MNLSLFFLFAKAHAVYKRCAEPVEVWMQVGRTCPFQ